MEAGRRDQKLRNPCLAAVGLPLPSVAEDRTATSVLTNQAFSWKSAYRRSEAVVEEDQSAADQLAVCRYNAPNLPLRIYSVSPS